MPDHFIQNAPVAAESLVIPVTACDGARCELLATLPAGRWQQLLYWMPAMGMPARHYLPLAQALAVAGVAVVLHEWRGIGSSDRRAGRDCDWGYRQLLQDDLPAGMAAVRQRWPQARCWLGGHSLGGQLGLLYASLHPHDFAGMVLVASGAPYWRRFRHGWLIGAAYALAPWLAALVGHLPGRRIGFGGNEARGVIADWARSGRSGRYAVAGMTRISSACWPRCNCRCWRCDCSRTGSVRRPRWHGCWASSVRPRVAWRRSRATTWMARRPTISAG